MIAPADHDQPRATRNTAIFALSLLATLAVCLAVYFPRLGADGLHSTEGHRAIPGWLALESGVYVPTVMFDAVYIRKPPGMPWSVALSTWIVGEPSEFAARLVSAACATGMALAACIAAACWFGPRWALVAGMAQALMPRFWTIGRTAEIEALLCFSTQVAAFIMMHLLVAPGLGAARDPSRSPLLRRAGLIFLAGVAIAVSILAKGHAGLPVIGGVALAACVLRRSLRPLREAALLMPLGLAALMLAPVALWYARALPPGPAVTEDLSKFLWDPSRLVDWLVVLPVLFLSALPASLAFLFPWGPDASREAIDHDDARALRFAQALALSALFAGLIFMLAGVSNPRYLLPILPLVPPIAAYVLRGMPGSFTPIRRSIARWMMLGSPIMLAAVLLAGALVFIWFIEPSEGRTSGRAEGRRLATLVDPSSTIWAGSIVGAKPELLWYMRRAARAASTDLRLLWRQDAVARAELPPPGSYLLLRQGEFDRYAAQPEAPPIAVVARGSVERTEFLLCIVTDHQPDRIH